MLDEKEAEQDSREESGNLNQNIILLSAPLCFLSKYPACVQIVAEFM